MKSQPLNRLVLGLLIVLTGLSGGCQLEKDDVALPEVRIDLETNGGLILPEGFNATVVVNRLDGMARHIAVNDNGDIYVKLRKPGSAGGNAVLRDTNADGRADLIRYFGKYPVHGPYGTGMKIHNGYLYFASQTTVYRQKLTSGEMVPESPMETVVVDDDPRTMREHIGKPLAFDDKGNIYVPFGAPSNACQDPKRTPGAPGLDPCPQLERHGGLWRFKADGVKQTRDDGVRVATGIRSLVCLAWNPSDQHVYTVVHGRDDLLRLFADRFSPWQSALLPSEEFLRIEEGADYGWPYCFYDQIQEKKVLAPEYGGDGNIIGRCADKDLPIMGFPGHWAPNGLLFYSGSQFPPRYRNGAFVAFHGSTNRAPYPQSGYIVAFVPFENGDPTGQIEVFADGFARVDTIKSVSDAVFRPMGLAEGPDGAMYISETEHGAIWKVEYTRPAEDFAMAQLASMNERASMNHIRTPHIVHDNLEGEAASDSENLYRLYCATCHQVDGMGDQSRFPPLVKTDWVTGDVDRLITVILEGAEGSMEVNGQKYNNVMPQHSFLDDSQVAEILTYIRSSWGNEAGPVTSAQVADIRSTLSKTL